MENEKLAVVEIAPLELVKNATDIAGICKDIVVNSAMEIQGRKYIKVEGWQSLATAHGCMAQSRDVERVAGGFRAIGEVRRMSDGAILSTAEGFVGEDEPTWFGGDTVDKQGNVKVLPKRPEYAIRAMTQTRAISRACRSAFAHIVVLMDAGLSTTPAEEVPHGGFNDEPAARPVATKPSKPGDWKSVEVHFGKDKGKKLGGMTPSNLLSLKKYMEKPSQYAPKQIDKDLLSAINAGLEACEMDQRTGDVIPMDQSKIMLKEKVAAAGYDVAKFLKVTERECLTFGAAKLDDVSENEASTITQNWGDFMDTYGDECK